MYVLTQCARQGFLSEREIFSMYAKFSQCMKNFLNVREIFLNVHEIFSTCAVDNVTKIIFTKNKGRWSKRVKATFKKD